MAGRGTYRITPTGNPPNNMAGYGDRGYYAGYQPPQQQAPAPIGFELHSQGNPPPSAAYPPRDDLYRPPQQQYPPPSHYPPPSGQQPSGQDYSHGGPPRPGSASNLPPVGFESERQSSGESRIRPSTQDTSDGAVRTTYRVKEVSCFHKLIA